MDNGQLKKTIGANLNYVKENFRMASTNSNVELIARVPLIPDHTTSVENLNQIMDFYMNVGLKRSICCHFINTVVTNTTI